MNGNSRLYDNVRKCNYAILEKESRRICADFGITESSAIAELWLSEVKEKEPNKEWLIVYCYI